MMSDRCWVGLHVHPDDIESSGWKDWLKEQGSSEEENDSERNYWHQQECSWGLLRPLEKLARKKVRFIGAHGSSHDWGEAIFFNDNESGTVEYSGGETWEESKIIVRIGDQVCLDEADYRKQLDLLQRYWKLSVEIMTCKSPSATTDADASKEQAAGPTPTENNTVLTATDT